MSNESSMGRERLRERVAAFLRKPQTAAQEQEPAVGRSPLLPSEVPFRQHLAGILGGGPSFGNKVVVNPVPVMAHSLMARGNSGTQPIQVQNQSSTGTLQPVNQARSI